MLTLCNKCQSIFYIFLHDGCVLICILDPRQLIRHIPLVTSVIDSSSRFRDSFYVETAGGRTLFDVKSLQPIRSIKDSIKT